MDVYEFDLALLENINSLGSRSWVKFMGSIPQKGLTFHNCPVSLLSLIHILPGLLGLGGPDAGLGRIKTFNAELECLMCCNTVIAQLRMNEIKKLVNGGGDSVCNICNKGKLCLFENDIFLLEPLVA